LLLSIYEAKAYTSELGDEIAQSGCLQGTIQCHPWYSSKRREKVGAVSDTLSQAIIFKAYMFSYDFHDVTCLAML